MITEEQFKLYYEFIINNISKLKQTYKYLDDYFNIESIHYLLSLLSTWEFDDKWVKNNMSEKIKDNKNKDIIREEFYNSLISNISVANNDLSEYNACGIYCLNTTTSYKISNNQSIQKIEGRKILIDKNLKEQKIALIYFLVYHMLIINSLIEDKGLCLTIDELNSDITNELNINNLCKLCTKDILTKESNLNNEEMPIWLKENNKAHQ